MSKRVHSPGRRQHLQAALGLLAAPVFATEDHTGGDPLGSMQYPSLRNQMIGRAEARFTDQVVVKGPAFADDAMNVPIWVDARALGEPVRNIRVAVDRNPIREVLSYEPRRALPVLGFRIRLQQASPIRAFVQVDSGRWFVGSTFVQASGGGCTVPGVSRADGSWSRTLGQVQARFFRLPGSSSERLRLRVMHPMDTGLAPGIPAFHLEWLELATLDGVTWWRLGLHEPVSENPLFTFELMPPRPAAFRLKGADNNGHRIDAEVAA
ncbi:MAG: quinoprotein dehydrogenase-associated SoxYZ-like carrier [Casimicrobiaceae bacterium]